MVDTNKLKAIIVERGTTQKHMADSLGISRRSWDYRIQKRKFSTDEAYKLIHILNIEDPNAIFFAN